MFILKSTHKAIVSLLEAELKTTVSGYETVCRQYEARIQDLQKLVFSPTRATEVPEIQAEADSIITQSEPILPEDELEEIDEALRERDRLFSGHFDGVL